MKNLNLYIFKNTENLGSSFEKMDSKFSQINKILNDLNQSKILLLKSKFNGASAVDNTANFINSNSKQTVRLNSYRSEPVKEFISNPKRFHETLLLCPKSTDANFNSANNYNNNNNFIRVNTKFTENPCYDSHCLSQVI